MIKNFNWLGKNNLSNLFGEIDSFLEFVCLLSISGRFILISFVVYGTTQI
jgi:hypothetical protein